MTSYILPQDEQDRQEHRLADLFEMIQTGVKMICDAREDAALPVSAAYQTAYASLLLFIFEDIMLIDPGDKVFLRAMYEKHALDETDIDVGGIMRDYEKTFAMIRKDIPNPLQVYVTHIDVSIQGAKIWANELYLNVSRRITLKAINEILDTLSMACDS